MSTVLIYFREKVIVNISVTSKCNSCQKEENLLQCQQCKLAYYCDRNCQTKDWADHKILCRKVPKATDKAEAKINSFRLSDYTLKNTGTFMVTQAVAERGQIVEEQFAQDLCYDAMDLEQGSSEKIEKILEALRQFPLSTEAWGMLGHFYRYEVKSRDFKTRECSEKALKMFETSILCARKLNPTWTEDRKEELPWGEIDNRPYLRSLCGRAHALKDLDRIDDAIVQAKKLLNSNPNDNQGIRLLLCSWFLEAGDTQGCTNLLTKYDTSHDTFLAYSNVLLQFLRWKQDNAIEDDVRRALFLALKENPFVPDLLTSRTVEEKYHDYISPGGICEAESYANDAHRVWHKHPTSIDWLKSQKFDGNKAPSELDLINLLKSGVRFQIESLHTDLDGKDSTFSSLIPTQRRERCFGCGCPDFIWPQQLSQPHKYNADILMHNNGETNQYRTESRWRKTKYRDITEVPFWSIILRFYEDDPESEDDLSDVEQFYEDDLTNENHPGNANGIKNENENEGDLSYVE